MRQLFLWFYCLPISHALALLLIAAVLFLELRKDLGGRRFWKSAILVLFICCLFVILFGTLGQRGGRETAMEPILLPFASYRAAIFGGEKELIRENFMNVALFFPGGLLGCELLPARWRRGRRILFAAGGALAISVGIELFQYGFGLGLAETDDVIHNTLGALLGAVCVTWRK